MARLLLNLRNVPDEEHLEVRELLDENGIEYYETEPSKWMVSFGGIWLADDSQADEALALLADYQQRRKEREQQRYREEVEAGEHETLAGRFQRNPARFIATLIGIGAVLYLALMPFITFL